MRPLSLAITFTDVVAWSSLHAVPLLWVIGLAVLANQLLRHAVRPAILQTVLRQATPETEIDLRKRAETLSNVIVRTGQLVVLVIAAVNVLDQFNVNIAPLLTGLGIGGIALGLGAQSLVRDTINGVFILLENQYGRGDLVSAAGVQGWVEDVNLRRTVLRDADGTLYSIPNSEVRVSANRTRGYSGIDLSVPLAGTSDLDRALELIGQVSRDLAADPQYTPLVLELPHVARVEALTDKGVTLRILGRAVAGRQFEVASALRRRIKRAFDAAGIQFGEAPPPPSPVPQSPPRPV